jgi:hypothetical protein
MAHVPCRSRVVNLFVGLVLLFVLSLPPPHPLNKKAITIATIKTIQGIDFFMADPLGSIYSFMKFFLWDIKRKVRLRGKGRHISKTVLSADLEYGMFLVHFSKFQKEEPLCP